jgi:prephenate dehydrogenase
MIPTRLKVLIVGLGQIGGSIGIDMIRNDLVNEVIGFDVDETTVAEALRRRAINSAALSLKDGVNRADLIILATPIRKIIELIPHVVSFANHEVAIMDVAGTKTEIFKALADIPEPVNYISTHPLAGNEKTGITAAGEWKFRGVDFILVPANGTEDKWIETVTLIIRSLGAQPLIMTAEKHDRLIAITSHLPYIFSLALTDLAVKYGQTNPHIWNLIGGSFKSATRVAVSSPDLTLDMFLTNKKELGTIVDELIDELRLIKEKIQNGDESLLKRMIIKAASKIKEL